MSQFCAAQEPPKAAVTAKAVASALIPGIIFPPPSIEIARKEACQMPFFVTNLA
jgi:hypothetical protein